MELISFLQTHAKQNSEREVAPPEHTFELTNSPHYIPPLLNLKGVAKGGEAVGGRRKLNPLTVRRAFHHC